MYLNAKLFEPFDFVSDNLLWEPKLRNAVHQNSAGQMQSLKYLYFMPGYRQVRRSRYSGGAAADYRNPLPGRGRLLGRLFKIVLAHIVRREPFKRAYRNWLSADSKHAASLALVFLRADAAAHCRQRRLRLELFGGRLRITLRYLCYKLRYVYVHGARRLAAGLRALQATACFVHRHFKSYTVGNFLKIGSSARRILLGHLHARQPGRLYFPCFLF